VVSVTDPHGHILDFLDRHFSHSSIYSLGRPVKNDEEYFESLLFDN
jgi:hypothetical protein